MSRHTQGLLLAALFAFTACGSGDEVLTVPPPPYATYYVDAALGSDTNTGGVDDPFRTITHALSMAEPKTRLRVRPGQYDTALGEVFPLVVPPDAILLADSEAPVVVQGSGLVPTGATPTPLPSPTSAAFVLGAGSTVSRFQVLSAPPVTGADLDVGVLMAEPLATLRYCLVVGLRDIGVWCLDGAAGSEVRTCVLYLHDVGIETRVTTGAVLMEGNSIFSNGIGIRCRETAPDLGGGPLDGDGGNRIFGNEAVDLLVHPTVGELYAEANAWDHVPPNDLSGDVFPLGTDIGRAVDGSVPATVYTDGASLAE